MVETKKLGSFRGLVRRWRGVNEGSMELGDVDADRAIKRILGIIDSTTSQERLYPVLMTVPKRTLRIAEGAGVKPAEVATFFEQFKAMRNMTWPFGLGGSLSG
jgi:signal recognition particle subunit SRP54